MDKKEAESCKDEAYKTGCWVLTSEQMPEDGKKVLVTDRYGDMQIAYHNHEGWRLALTGHLFAHNLKVWMPLPEPYKQDN